MNSITQTLLTNWNFMRWLRLAFGIFIGIQAIQLRDPLSGVFSAFFLFQAFTNTGCCGAQGCAAPLTKDSSEKSDIEQVEFEEIKNTKN